MSKEGAGDVEQLARWMLCCLGLGRLCTVCVCACLGAGAVFHSLISPAGFCALLRLSI